MMRVTHSLLMIMVVIGAASPILYTAEPTNNASINADGTLNNLGAIEGLPKTVGFNGIAAF